jgi:hypothetical protein
VRSRRVSDLNAPITTGHISTATCELGNISWRLGRPSDAAGCHAAVEAHQGAAETLARLEKNVVANGVDLNAQPFTLGPWLEIGSGRISSVIGAGPESLYKARQLERGSRRKPFDILVS